MSNGIYQAITAAMAEISPIAKEKVNDKQGYKFRGIDQVMNALAPILAKHKIFVYPEVISKEREDRKSGSGSSMIFSILTIKYHFATEDGSEICATVVGEGFDTGDKASNKAMAVAFKYACLQMFCIP
ncbi:MAG: ERF family protein, partial [Clostridiales bacterium]|nr:ERF family protein [Clostridiales bacterium]